MSLFLTVFHILICLFLIVLVLLQPGKGSDFGAVFGGGSQTVFGARGASTFLSKFTVIVAILFALSTLLLIKFKSAGDTKSVLDNVKAPVQKVETQPAQTETLPAALAETQLTETKSAETQKHFSKSKKKK